MNGSNVNIFKSIFGNRKKLTTLFCFTGVLGIVGVKPISTDVDKRLLQKYFRNQCSLEEIEQVLDWFQTEEGAAYFEQRLNQDMERYAEEESLLLHPVVPTEEMFLGIKKKRSRIRRSRVMRQWFLRAVVVLLIACSVLSIGYWLLSDAGLMSAEVPNEDIVYRTITTDEDQNRLITLGDGSLIRLNSNSSIRIPDNFTNGHRMVQLHGEAFFEVAQDVERPFTVQADQALIRVLGTEFNVKVDRNHRQVQVAVSEGRVSLSGQEDESGREAILTEETFGLYQIDDGEILIEKTPVANYLSWMSGRLYFLNESLPVVSRYLERLYGVTFHYESNDFKEMYLSTNMETGELESVLEIISRTLGIDYRYDKEEKLVTFIN